MSLAKSKSQKAKAQEPKTFFSWMFDMQVSSEPHTDVTSETRIKPALVVARPCIVFEFGLLHLKTPLRDSLQQNSPPLG